jgi:hypothetical protein
VSVVACLKGSVVIYAFTRPCKQVRERALDEVNITFVMEYVSRKRLPAALD